MLNGLEENKEFYISNNGMTSTKCQCFLCTSKMYSVSLVYRFPQKFQGFLDSYYRQLFPQIPPS